MDKAATYLHGTSPSEQERLSLLNRLMNEAALRELALQGGERIVDFGCGLGQLSRAADRLLPPAEPRDELTEDEEIALAAAAIWQLEQDQRAALSAPQTASQESAWARAGRLGALRRPR